MFVSNEYDMYIRKYIIYTIYNAQYITKKEKEKRERPSKRPDSTKYWTDFHSLSSELKRDKKGTRQMLSCC